MEKPLDTSKTGDDVGDTEEKDLQHEYGFPNGCLIQNGQQFRWYTAERKYTDFSYLGHWVKVKGHIGMILPRDTPLFPSWSFLKISIQNLQRFMRNEAEGNFSLKVMGSRSKVTSVRFYHATHLPPLVHPPCKFQSKISNGLEVIERKGNVRTADGGQRTADGGHTPKNNSIPATYVGGDAN